MNFIKFNHTGGIAIINLTRVFRVNISGTSVTFFSDATTSTNYNFSTTSDSTRIIKQIEGLVTIIDLDQLADQ
jgi:hypothetical protein